MYNLEPQERYEQRKLLRDMTLTEVIVIRQCLENVSDKIKINSHSQYRGKQRYITEEEIMECIKHGTIIETHQVNDRLRILLRNKNKTHDNDTCCVIDIFSGRVITAFSNKTYDNHSTLDESKYNDKLDIISIIYNYKFKERSDKNGTKQGNK